MWPIDLFNQHALDKISPAAEWNRAPRSNYISFFSFWLIPYTTQIASRLMNRT